MCQNSSTPSLSEADTDTDAFQFTQGTTNLASISRDKAFQNNLLNHEYGKRRQELTEMENEIPTDSVKLVAKNQHEPGLSSPKHLHINHDNQKDGRQVKRRKTELSHANKPVEKGRTCLKVDTVTPKSKAGVTLEPCILRTNSHSHGTGTIFTLVKTGYLLHRYTLLT